MGDDLDRDGATDDAERAAGVLRRYVVAKGLFRGKGRPDERVFSGLEYDIRHGIRAFLFPGVEVWIDPTMPTVIANDGGPEPKFFEAIINGDDRAIDMPPDELARWREWIFTGVGVPPRIP